MMPQTFSSAWQPMPQTGPMGGCDSCGESWDSGSQYEVIETYGDPGMQMETLSPAAEPWQELPPPVPEESSSYRYRSSSPADYEAQQRLEEIYQAGFHGKPERVPLPGRRVEAREYRGRPVPANRQPRRVTQTRHQSDDDIPTLEIPWM